MPYITERQAYPGGPFQFLAQHGEESEHVAYIGRNVIGDWRTISELTNSPRREGGFILTIKRRDESRERFRIRVES